MSHNKIILLIGILLACMPFLGFPSSLKTIFYVCAGIILIIKAVLGHIRRRSPIVEERRQVITEVFVESNGSPRV